MTARDFGHHEARAGGLVRFPQLLERGVDLRQRDLGVRLRLQAGRDPRGLVQLLGERLGRERPVGREQQRLENAEQLHPLIFGDSAEKGKFFRLSFEYRACLNGCVLRALLLALLLPLTLRADPAIHRGINLGNALETPHEGQWGVVLQPGYFPTIHAAGFDTIRVPIDWVNHSGPAPSYSIDPKFFDRIDWVVANAKNNHLNVILDYHADPDLIKNPDLFADRFVALWQQIAGHYQHEPDEVLFELLNEPHDPLTADKWNALIPRALAVIRPTNPTREVVVGPVQWNSFNRLPDLQLPDNDRHLLVTFHYYLPMEFTHQGASWIGAASQKWLGTKWEGTDEEKRIIVHDFGLANDWAGTHHRPLYLGEFGSYSTGDMASRARWTACCARTAESLGIGWSYWEFCSGFGAYDPKANAWRQPLLNALVPPH
jgi:endoglucanase